MDRETEGLIRIQGITSPEMAAIEERLERIGERPSGTFALRQGEGKRERLILKGYAIEEDTLYLGVVPQPVP